MSKIIIGLITLFIPMVSHAEGSFPLEHSNSWDEDRNGCMLNEKRYPVGKMLAMNRALIESHQNNGGFVSDGDAIMMRCTYLVDPLAEDHPKVAEREYRWVAFSWARM
tara:strand:- start:3909 stop:4232 length:324 start_codon:yes stop_codon:yes gene_type:complete